MKAVKMNAVVDKNHTIVLRVPEDVAEGPAEVIVLLREESSVPRGSVAADPEAWIRGFKSWVAAHDPSLPVLPKEALRREEIYKERA
jgi:hypothetical protein